MTDDTDDRAKLWSLIHGIRFAMFTTRHANGHLHSRPMTTQNSRIDEDESLWFFMSRSGDSVHELEVQPQVNVAYADPDADTYVSVSGVAEIVDEPDLKRRLWSKMNEAYFPDGPEDPDLALVGVQITHADYWNVKSNKLVQLLKMAKAAATGKPPPDLGETGHVQMR